MTKTSDNWKSLPGNFDKVNSFILFPSDNEYGIPIITKDDYVPEWLVPYGQRIRTDKGMDGGAVHTFLDDYRFETLWSRPFDTLSAIKNIGAGLSPDFSLFSNFPIAVQLWNTYRNRWVGAFWQSHGIKVIPTIGWSDERSYDFCFCGVEEGSIVAISTVGVNSNAWVSTLFRRGYFEMTKRIKPSLVLCYGHKSLLKLEEYNKVKWYPSYWKSIKDARKET